VAGPRTVGGKLGDHRRGQLFVALAAVAWSSAGVLQRELHLGTATQLAGRALFAALALFLLTTLFRGAGFGAAFGTMGVAGLAVASCTAVASGTFIFALNHTTVANVLFMQALSPIVAALLARVAIGEAVSRRTMTAMVVALAGVGVIVGGPGADRGLGVGISFVMTLAFAVATVVTRYRRDISMLPALCLSQLFVLAVAAPLSHPGSVDPRDLGLLIALGFGQMALGLAFFSIGARLIPASEGALITLLEVVLAPLWVWIAISERPSLASLAGGAVVILAVVLQATAPAPRRVSPAADVP
jgi:drug/metabolite transporter (DMT)-like permease